jgi:hypothetical protein
MQRMPQSRMFRALLMVLLCAVIGGCGPATEEYTYVSVSGKVTCNGEPVTGGTITFWPMIPDEEDEYDEEGEVIEKDQLRNPGRPAIAAIQADGTFVLSTSTSDGIEAGAVIGAHRITIDHPRKDGVGGAADDSDELEDDWAGRKVGNPFLAMLPCEPPMDLEVVLPEGDSVLNLEMSGGGTVTRESPDTD